MNRFCAKTNKFLYFSGEVIPIHGKIIGKSERPTTYIVLQPTNQQLINESRKITITSGWLALGSFQT